MIKESRYFVLIPSNQGSHSNPDTSGFRNGTDVLIPSNQGSHSNNLIITVQFTLKVLIPSNQGSHSNGDEAFECDSKLRLNPF